MEKIHEISDFLEAKVEGNILKNVKLLGLQSKNGYNYTESAIKNAIDKYKEASSYTDHSFSSNRKIGEQIAVIKDPFFAAGKGLFAKEVHFNPKHPQTEQVLWWAEHHPHKMGFSHDISGVMDAKRENVTEIQLVHSVDVVTTPATTKGFFEALNKGMDEKDIDKSKVPALIAAITEAVLAATPVRKTEDTMDFTKLTLEDLKKNAPQLVDAIEAPLKQVTKEAVTAALTQEKRVQDALLKLPEKARTAVFIESLRAVAGDDAKVTALVEDRKLAFEPEPRSTAGGKQEGIGKTEKAKEEEKEVAKSPADQIRSMFIKKQEK